MTLVIKFEAGLRPVIKHGTHDQKTHGSWATGASSAWSIEKKGNETTFRREKYTDDRSGFVEVTIPNKLLSDPALKADIDNALNTIEKLHDSFPIKTRVTFREGELGGQNFTAETSSTNLVYGVVTVHDISAIDVSRKFFNEDSESQAHILTHEWGHATDSRSVDIARQQADKFSYAKFEDDSIPMTDYGYRSNREAYAEAFAIKFNNSHKGGIYSSQVQQTDKWEEVFKIFELDTVNKAVGKRISFKVWDTFDANNPPKLIEDYAPTMQKHQEHDQSTHGNWANSSERSAKEIEVQQRITQIEHQSYPVDEDGMSSNRVTAIYETKDGTKIKLLHDNEKTADGNISMTTKAYLFVDGGVKQIADLESSRPNNRVPEAGAIIDRIQVEPEYKRQGIATAMLNFARSYSQDNIKIDHSFSLTDDAKGWSGVVKHGTHDQSSHGNWAEGSEGSSKELSNDDIKDIISNSDTVNEMYQKVAERLGKSMKPQLADLSEEEINFYRGVTDVDRDAQRLLDGNIPFTPFQTWGQGIYVSSEPDYAATYGDLIRLKLDKSAKLVEGEIAWSKAYSLFDKDSSLDMPKILERITSGKMDNFSDSDIANIYWAAKGYDGYSAYATGRAEVVLFNADKLTVNKADIGGAVKKHQQGLHDQRTHGSWAGGGGAGVDITEALDEVFFKEKLDINRSSLSADKPGLQVESAMIRAGNNVETLDLIENMDFEESNAGKAYGDNALKIIAERQGFTGKPTTVASLDDLQEKQKTEAGIIVFRGIANYSSTGDSEVTYTAEQALTDFRQGEYFGGWGAFGNGTYTTVEIDSAQSYADDVDPDNNKLGNGKVMAMHIPKTALAPTADVVKTVMKEMVWGGEKSHRNNVGRRLAAMGYQYYDAGYVQSDKAGVFVVLDRSMLTVAEKAVGG
jgi:GNAT superfamily N-acetyltransferase